MRVFRSSGLPLNAAVGLVAAGVLSLALPSCKSSCLKGEEGCQVESPCEKLTFSCAGDSMLEVRSLSQSDAMALRGGLDALAGKGDVLLSNGQVSVVIAGIGNQNYLDPNGGSILDLASRDKKNDTLTQIQTISGILPRDSTHYTELRIIDERPKRVAVQVRGTFFETPSVQVATLYEVRPCEPGVRVRTELVNQLPDPQLFSLSDGYYWSGREPLAFTPGNGFVHPSFNLLTINDVYRNSEFIAAATQSTPDVSYAGVSCTHDQMEGINSRQVSTAGLARTVVFPREYQVFERFLAVAATPDAGGAIDVAQKVRSMLRQTPLATLKGKVDRGGQRLGEMRLASLVINQLSEGGQKAPWTHVVPDKNGAFSALVPSGRDYQIEVHSFGRKVLEQEVRGVAADKDVGVLKVPSSALLRVKVKNDKGVDIDAEVFVVPASGQGDKFEGSYHGTDEKCSPFLGPAHGGSPACNRFLVSARDGAVVDVPPGKFHFYAYHGPFHTIERQTLDLAPQDQTINFTLRQLSLVPQGAVSADLHVHGAASFDSTIPDADRVLAFSAADVGVLIATDHDVVYDYTALIESMGLSDRIVSVAGVETTGHIPYFKTPGGSFPLVIGHYNFWPLTFAPGTPRNGGPFEEFVEPGELFDRVEPLYQKGRVSIAQLNHPFADAEFGRDLGFPKALGLNLLVDLPTKDDGTAAGMYVRAPKGGHKNNDHHSQEVMNGTANELFLAYRAFWFYTLNQGQLKTGTANSDSHGLTDNNIGTPRNLVYAATQVGKMFEVDRLNDAIRKGKVLGTNGPIIEATVDAEGGKEMAYGLEPFKPAASGNLKLKVSAAPWVPVEEIRIYVNGRLAKKISGDTVQKPKDPFGTADLVRYMGSVPLSEILPASGDAWVVVEAGAPLVVYGDLGGGTNDEPDGVPDTSDNNGDGKVDASDIAAGQKVGPLKNPPAPTDENDPRFHFYSVQTGGYPLSFINPFVLDRDGNGRFDAPLSKGAK